MTFRDSEFGRSRGLLWNPATVAVFGIEDVSVPVFLGCSAVHPGTGRSHDDCKTGTGSGPNGGARRNSADGVATTRT